MTPCYCIPDHLDAFNTTNLFRSDTAQRDGRQYRQFRHMPNVPPLPRLQMQEAAFMPRTSELKMATRNLFHPLGGWGDRLPRRHPGHHSMEPLGFCIRYGTMRLFSSANGLVTLFWDQPQYYYTSS